MIRKGPVITTTMASDQVCKLFCDLFYIKPNSTQLDFLIIVTDFGISLVKPSPSKTVHQIGI
jgi:hypothetical protein